MQNILHCVKLPNYDIIISFSKCIISPDFILFIPNYEFIILSDIQYEVDLYVSWVYT